MDRSVTIIMDRSATTPPIWLLMVGIGCLIISVVTLYIQRNSHLNPEQLAEIERKKAERAAMAAAYQAEMQAKQTEEARIRAEAERVRAEEGRQRAIEANKYKDCTPEQRAEWPELQRQIALNDPIRHKNHQDWLAFEKAMKIKLLEEKIIPKFKLWAMTHHIAVPDKPHPDLMQRFMVGFLTPDPMAIDLLRESEDDLVRMLAAHAPKSHASPAP